jgi:hypothetical protein
MSRTEWLWLVLSLLAILAAIIYPQFAYSESAYKLYLHNRDSENYYHVRLKNEDTGWYDARNIEAGSCVEIYRLESGEYSIRTYQDGKMGGHYSSFKIRNDHKCLEITPVTGKLRSCSRSYCD